MTHQNGAVLAAGEFYGMPPGFQQRSTGIAFVPLNFNVAILYRTTGTTGLFKLLGKFLQICGLQLEPADRGNGFTATTFGFSSNPDDTIAVASWVSLAADTCCYRTPTLGAVSSGLG
jgi:hypothetical protein